VPSPRLPVTGSSRTRAAPGWFVGADGASSSGYVADCKRLPTGRRGISASPGRRRRCDLHGRASAYLADALREDLDQGRADRRIVVPRPSELGRLVRASKDCRLTLACCPSRQGASPTSPVAPVFQHCQRTRDLRRVRPAFPPLPSAATASVVPLENGLQTVGEAVGGVFVWHEKPPNQAILRARERRDRTQEVAGSSPASSMKTAANRRVSLVGRERMITSRRSDLRCTQRYS
jgi:hypothetical protein